MRKRWLSPCALSFCLIFQVAFFGAASHADQAPEERDAAILGDEPTLADYLTYAALNNAGLEAAFNRWKAAVEQAPQVGALPNPQFTYTRMVQEVDSGADHYILSQAFPWFGVRGLERAMADETANDLYQAFQAAKLQLFYQVKDAYYEYSYLERAIAVTAENVRLLKHFESVAQAQYKAGAPLAGVIKAQVELGKLDEQLRSLQDLRDPLVARLNAALNRPHDADLPWPQNAPRHAAPLDDSEIWETLHTMNPELKGWDHAVTREEHSVRLAKKAYYPTIMLGVDYAYMSDERHADGSSSGQDEWMAMVGVEIPLWRGKNRAGVAEARYRLDAAAQARENATRQLEAQLKMALYRFRDAERKINLYGKTLIREAEQSLSVTEEAYRAGKMDFLNLIDAERLLLEFQLAHERALADREQRLAELEMLVGTPIGIDEGEGN